MASASVLMSKLISMMILVAVGYAAVKLKVLDSSGSKMLSRLTVFILQPCLIFHSFQIDITQERLSGFLWTLFLGFAVYFIWIIALELLKKPLHLDPIDRLTLIYSNVGNLILPIVDMLLGSEYVFYASALQIPFNLLIWTHGVRAISHQHKIRFSRIILNPNVLALLAGVAFGLLQIRLPSILDTSVDGLGDTVGPISMLIIGMSIAESNLKQVFTDGRAYAVSFGRLILMPMTVLAILYLSGIMTRHPQLIPVFQVSFIALAAPPASTVSQLAIVYDRRPYDAAVYNVLSTMACIFTMPLMLKLYEIVFGG